MTALVHSATLSGATGAPVVVEVHSSTGVPGFTIVGLPDAAVRESRDRVRAALLSSGYPWPQRRVTVNLAPSGVKKAGSGLDLAIAVGVLVTESVLPPASVGDAAFVGELGLDGSLRHVPGTIALADAVRVGRLVVPACDVPEAAVVRPQSALGAGTLREVVEALRGLAAWPVTVRSAARGAPGAPGPARAAGEPDGGGEAGAASRWRARAVAQVGDLAEVKGQRVGRRAVEVAAAGGHHLLMVGPPGSGKTMLARRVVALLPPLTRAEALEVTRVHSAAGYPPPDAGLVWDPPLRAPHHGASAVSLVGGGTAALRPGELSLATRGVLFLDEMGEFPAAVLDALRQPLEEGIVRVSRARGSVTFPAHVLLVGATNPCPCGDGGAPGACRCSPAARARYLRRLSGPLLDRFDLVVPLRRTEARELVRAAPAEATCTVAARVDAARARARARGVEPNAAIPSRALPTLAALEPGAAALLEGHVRAGRLSGRGFDRVRRVARTIADLAGDDGPVAQRHVAEALALRAGRDVLDVTP